eukprot:g43190.t1
MEVACGPGEDHGDSHNGASEGLENDGNIKIKTLTGSQCCSANTGDFDVAPPLPLRTSLVFEQDNQDGTTYGRFNKLKYKEQQALLVLGDKSTNKESLANPLYSMGMDIRKPQPSRRQSPMSSVIYSLAVEPQPIYNEAFEPPGVNPSTDVVYAEVDVEQWKTGVVPAASAEHAQAKDQLYEDTLDKKNSTNCPENTYEQIPEEFSRRGQAKPVTAEK